MTTVAVLGTGTMGSGMARSLLREGFDVRVWNRTADKARALESDGATVCSEVGEAVRAADVVVLVVFDAAAVLEVLGQAAELLPADAIVLQCSTIGPEGAERVARFAAEHELQVLDCPVLGTKKPAEDGTLVMLPSGDPALRDKTHGVLDALGAKTVWAGDQPGLGSALKLAANAWIASITAATAQSIGLAQGQGVDPNLFLEAIAGGGADSPYAHVKGKAMIVGNSEVSFELDGLRKDLALMHQAAVRVGTATGLLNALQDAFASASEAGHGSDDIAAVINTFVPKH